jgi:hypothetical protein
MAFLLATVGTSCALFAAALTATFLKQFLLTLNAFSGQVTNLLAKMAACKRLLALLSTVGIAFFTEDVCH